MNTEEKKDKNSDKISFWKANRVLFAFLVLVFLLIFTFCFVFLFPKLSTKTFKEDISYEKTTTLFSISKVVCYSNAYGIHQTESQGKWNLNLGHYTDIAVYFNSQKDISNIYIDAISFERSNIGNVSLSSLEAKDFSKSPISKESSSILDASSLSSVPSASNTENIITNEITSSSENSTNYDYLNVQTPERIEVSSNSPIFIRYLNNNLKENCLISDIENPLTFNGSLLKRGKVILSSLKNTISFTIHIIDNTGKEFTYPLAIPIRLENKEEGKNIYEGDFMEELQFSNAYFHVN